MNRTAADDPTRPYLPLTELHAMLGIPDPRPDWMR